MTRLPDFRLETYFSRWEFTARHHLTASDAQTMTLAELLALADDEDRDALGTCPWATPRPSATRPCGRRSPRRTSRPTPTTSSASRAPRRRLYLAMHVLLGAR